MSRSDASNAAFSTRSSLTSVSVFSRSARRCSGDTSALPKRMRPHSASGCRGVFCKSCEQLHSTQVCGVSRRRARNSSIRRDLPSPGSPTISISCPSPCRYVGEVEFKGETLKSEQPAILDRDVFDAVQAKLDEQANNHKATRTNSEGLLTGRIFDDRANRMSPSHARKGGHKYRYYLSSALLQGTAEHAGSVRRVPAAEIEALVISAVRDNSNHPRRSTTAASSTLRSRKSKCM
jgi:hypothetical protein